MASSVPFASRATMEYPVLGPERRLTLPVVTPAPCVSEEEEGGTMYPKRKSRFASL